MALLISLGDKKSEDIWVKFPKSEDKERTTYTENGVRPSLIFLSVSKG